MGAAAVLKQFARLGRHTAARSPSAEDTIAANLDYYNGVVLGATALGERAASPEVYEPTLAILDQLERDDYVEYVKAFITRGRRSRAPHGATRTSRRCCTPQRRQLGRSRISRSACAAGAAWPSSVRWPRPARSSGSTCGSRSTPGCPIRVADHVRSELSRLGHSGELELIIGQQP